MKFIPLALIFFIACKTPSKTGMIEKTWVLVELNGNVINADSSTHKLPQITFTGSENKFNGNTGCNNMAGSYELKEGNRIRLYNVITTKMACLNSMELENRFLEVINMADNYNLNGDSLTLNKARTAPLARFKSM